MNTIDFSIVVPVYRSKRTLKEICRRIVATFEKMGKVFEIIFVDDFSNDGSWRTLKDLKSVYPEKVRIIKLAKNFGQHNATLCGLHHGNGQTVITIDDDLQHLPEEIPALIERFNQTGADVVYGIPRDKQHSLFRKTGSRFIKFLARQSRSRAGEGSSFRLISKRICQKFRAHHQPFIFIDEILNWYTDSIEFVPVEHKRRESGESGYSVLKLIFLTGNLIIFYTTIPLKILTYIGLTSSVITFLLGLSFIIIKIFFNVPVQGFTAIIVTILFSTSIILLCFGVVGEYLSRLALVVNSKPLYSIEEIDL